ncbi:MAG: fumarate hydratase [Desulfobulbaceae bacterium]|uniref:Fumarate hydratase n=1 Tax=Candidatus Desulfobia pelagia TaxID=2841692 RepID=A0A8J6TG20_9BACT|nr:fumarate hydratase [Candidatus Desulfobia pelagia]
MREIQSAVITEAVKAITMEASICLEPDILDALVQARDRETSPLAKNVLNILMVNADIASREKIPVCQDTGVAVVFAEVGQDVRVEGSLEEAIQKGVKDGYEEGYLRKSICDPVTRKNTGTNTPAVIHYEIVPGDTIKLSMLPKGCGSENMSGLVMLPPSAGIQGMVDFVVDLVVKAGSNPCPPVTVGVGMGGTFEKAALLAKKSLFRPLGQAAERDDVAQLEKEILDKINEKGSGVHGLGGCNTALAVHIEAFPSHIASLPVAVNIQCHAHRHKEVTL